ncbi:MAG: ribonuclease P protein component [bacterium]|nr:ribonuclease P protein component [bacterium]
MLPKKRRLLASHFAPLQKGRLFSSQHFSLRIAPGKAGDSLRAAAVAGSGVARKAHERALLRRRIYAVVREVIPASAEGLHLAVFARKGAPALSFQVVRKELGSLLRGALRL